MVFFHQVAGKGEAKYSDFSDLLDPERRKSFLVQTCWIYGRYLTYL